MAWCLTTPSHFLRWCWIFINEVPWQPFECNFTPRAEASIFEAYPFKIIATSPKCKGQWDPFKIWYYTYGSQTLQAASTGKKTCLLKSLSGYWWLCLTILSICWHSQQSRLRSAIFVWGKTLDVFVTFRCQYMRIWCPKQISQAGISNCITWYSVGCNCSS